MRDVTSRLARLERERAGRESRAVAAAGRRLPHWPEHWHPAAYWNDLADWQMRQYSADVNQRWFDGRLPEGEFPDDEMPWATEQDRESARGFWWAFTTFCRWAEQREAEGRAPPPAAG